MKPFYLFAKILMTGGIVLGLQLASSRILIPFFGVSLYVWSAILSVTLIALALGYKFGGDLTLRLPRERLLLLYASAGALAAVWINICVWTYPFLFLFIADFNLVIGSILACLFILFIPLLVLSALNPLLVALLPDNERQGDGGAGRVFFISTIGSVLGVFVTAYGMMPIFSNYQAIVVLSGLSALLSVFLLYKLRGSSDGLCQPALALSLGALVIAVLTFATGGLERIRGVTDHNKTQWRIVHSVPSYFGSVQIVDTESANGQKRRALFTDGLMQNQFMPGNVSSTLYTYALEQLAMAAANQPRSALVLGIGAGVIPQNFSDRGLEVHAVDINPKIVDIAREYMEFDPEYMTLSYEDARMAVRNCKTGYDIVAVDLFRGDGIPEHLVTREFFADIQNCLNDGGVMVMNSFMNLHEPAAEYALVKTIGSVFGEVLFIQRPPRHSPDFTVAFLVTRKGGEVGPLIPEYEGIPKSLRQELAEAMKRAKVVRPDDADMQGYPILTDISNQWKHLAYSSELAYRRSIARQLPWQVLMN